MKIKTKLNLGIGLLFILIIVLASIGVRQINKLSNDSKNILEDNYLSLEYSRQMLNEISNLSTDSKAGDNFKVYLKKQQNNLTESGEKEETDSLSMNFNQLLSNPQNLNTQQQVQKNLNDIMKFNMNAIVKKNKIAEKTAHDATLWIAIAGTLCFLIAFSLFVNFPSSIANPIKELTEGITKIADKNYSERLHFESNTEFNELSIAFNLMAEKLEDYENSNLAKILSEKQRIEILINKMPEPIIGLDENKKILFVNEQAMNLLDLTMNIIGKPADNIALENDLMRSLIKEMEEYKDSAHQNKSTEPLKIFTNGKESFFDKEIVNIFSPSMSSDVLEKLIGHVIILKNITPFKELDVAKTNFIGTISHELKTPISSILMSTKLLEDHRIGSLNHEQKQLIINIEDDSNRLLRITGELLNIAQVETGKIEMKLSPSNPIEIVKYAVEATKSQAQDKNITLEIIANEPIPIIYANSEKTAWVLTNLILNAIHYSYENSKIIVSTSSKDGLFVIFSVQDFGKGIELKYHEKIFNRYFRVPGGEENGSGLGLAISKEFIEGQGGKIFVESEFGTGSKFSFVLKTFDVKTDKNNLHLF